MSEPGEQAMAPAFAEKKGRSSYIAGPWYDWIFFLLPPLAALAVGALIDGTPFSTRAIRIQDQRTTWAGLAIGALTHAHLAAALVRSHGNAEIFRRYPVRFLAVPLVLFAGLMMSMWLVVCATVLVVFWDVYHSGLQTFGFARIYDRNGGNDPTVGRRLDWWLSHVLYAGPIVAGATMLAHFRAFTVFEEVDAAFFTAIPVFMKTHQRYFTWAVVVAGTLFLVYYVFSYWRLHRRGYKVSFLKIYLLATTGLCSIYTWGFNPWGQAFFIMNLFHAVQYLGLVWWSENKGLKARLRVDKLRVGTPLVAALFVGVLLAYGTWAELVPSEDRALWSIAQVVALMHFWYDGFIWSVTKKQV